MPTVTAGQLLAMPIERDPAARQLLCAPLDPRYQLDFPFTPGDAPDMEEARGSLTGSRTGRAVGAPKRQIVAPSGADLVKNVDSLKDALATIPGERLISGRPWSRNALRALLAEDGKILTFPDLHHLRRLVDKACFDKMEPNVDALPMQGGVAYLKSLYRQHAAELRHVGSMEDFQRFLLHRTPARRATLNDLEDLSRNYEPWRSLPLFSDRSPDGKIRSRVTSQSVVAPSTQTQELRP